jgi:hypothetical protein
LKRLTVSLLGGFVIFALLLLAIFCFLGFKQGTIRVALSDVANADVTNVRVHVCKKDFFLGRMQKGMSTEIIHRTRCEGALNVRFETVSGRVVTSEDYYVPDDPFTLKYFIVIRDGAVDIRIDTKS